MYFAFLYLFLKEFFEKIAFILFYFIGLVIKKLAQFLFKKHVANTTYSAVYANNFLHALLLNKLMSREFFKCIQFLQLKF